MCACKNITLKSANSWHAMQYIVAYTAVYMVQALPPTYLSVFILEIPAAYCCHLEKKSIFRSITRNFLFVTFILFLGKHNKYLLINNLTLSPYHKSNT